MTKCGVIYDDMGYSTKVAKIEYENKDHAKEAKEVLNGMIIYDLIYYYIIFSYSFLILFF